jgi:hypothetical protein
MFEDIGIDCPDGRKKKRSTAPPPPTPSPSFHCEGLDEAGKLELSSLGRMEVTYVNVVKKLNNSPSGPKIEEPSEQTVNLSGNSEVTETSSQDGLSSPVKFGSELKDSDETSRAQTDIANESTEINNNEASSDRSTNADLENHVEKNGAADGMRMKECSKKTGAGAKQKEEFSKETGADAKQKEESIRETGADAKQKEECSKETVAADAKQKEECNKEDVTESSPKNDGTPPQGSNTFVIKEEHLNTLPGVPELPVGGNATLSAGIEVLSVTKIIENGFAKEVMEEIDVNMRILKEEVVDQSIRKSMRKSTISNLSSEEILTELSTTDIIILDGVQPVNTLDAEAESVSSQCSDQTSSVQQGVLLSVQTLENSSVHQGVQLSVQTLENSSVQQGVLLSVQTLENNSVQQGGLLSVQTLENTSVQIGSAPAHRDEEELKLAIMEEKISTRPGTELSSCGSLSEGRLEHKAPSLHSLGHLLSFGDTTKRIELG